MDGGQTPPTMTVYYVLIPERDALNHITDTISFVIPPPRSQLDGWRGVRGREAGTDCSALLRRCCYFIGDESGEWGWEDALVTIWEWDFFRFFELFRTWGEEEKDRGDWGLYLDRIWEISIL